MGQGNESMTTNTGQQGKRARDKNAGAGQLGQESLGRKAWAGQPGQDSQDRTARECPDGTGRKRKRGQNGQNITEGQISWDKTTEMRHHGSYDSKVRTLHLGHDIGYDAGQETQSYQSGQVGLTGQPEQLRQDRTERTGCQDMTTMTRLWGW